MDIINANLTKMPLASVIGFPALITSYRVSKQTVHLNLFVYELQGDFERDDPIIVTHEAKEDFCSTIITPVPLLMDGMSQLLLSPGDIVMDAESRYYTPAVFEARFNP